MWPWEHVVVGYVAYSLWARLRYGESPGGAEALAVGGGSLLPDLIDKPLAWEFGVFETGYALGHSIFFAVPLAIAAGLAGRAIGRPPVGVAFAVGYLLHLPADVLDSYVRGGRVQVEIICWPVCEPATAGTERGFRDQTMVLVGGYVNDLLAGSPSTYLLVQFGLAVLAVSLWVTDGAPPVGGLFGRRRDDTNESLNESDQDEKQPVENEQ